MADDFEYTLAVQWGIEAIEELRVALILAEQPRLQVVFDLLNVASEGRSSHMQVYGVAQKVFHRAWLVADTHGYFAAPLLFKNNFVRKLPGKSLAVTQEVWAKVADELTDMPDSDECRRLADAVNHAASKAALMRQDLSQQIHEAGAETVEMANLTGKLLFAAELSRAHSRRAVSDESTAEAFPRSLPTDAVPVRTKRFKVALSFPGEHRGLLGQVADRLADRIGRERVFYDKYYEAELARPDLDTYLQRIYHGDSGLIAVFLCAEYERKEWCGLEWRAIRDLIKRKEPSTIMPFRFDDTHIEGLFSIDGYVSAKGRSPEELADLILQRLEFNDRSCACRV